MTKETNLPGGMSYMASELAMQEINTGHRHKICLIDTGLSYIDYVKRYGGSLVSFDKERIVITEPNKD